MGSCCRLDCCGSPPKEFRPGQNYARLRRECRANKCQFEDDEFPADESSLRLNVDVSATRSSVRWKRPAELSDRPRLVVGRLNSSNITQGSLGNCWFVAACCALARVERLWKQVVPDSRDQDWPEDGTTMSSSSSSSACGIFHFRLWLFGRWTDVVVDDRLPTVDGHLTFAHSQVRDEFWCALLEKAYAKIFGSYAALESGNLVDALVDFTAGFAERVDLVAENVRTSELDRLELFARLVKRALDKQALMCCAIKASSQTEMERRTARGLVKGHAYCITDVRSVDIARTGLLAIFHNRQRLNMIRLRNPWGEKEWNGAFSDSPGGDGGSSADASWCYSTAGLQRLFASSMEWSKVSASDRKKIGLTYHEDGEFWMTFEDFCQHFTDVSICNLVNTAVCSLRRTWHEYAYFGRWSIGPRLSKTDRAGGCSNHPDTFLRNPQYRFDVGSDGLKLLMMLQQEDVRGASATTPTAMMMMMTTTTRPNRAKPLSIGFEILKVEVNRKYRVHTMKRVVSRSDYGETRNVFHECRLDRGVYVLLPTTFTPRLKGNFLLRMFADDNVRMRELKSEAPSKSTTLCCLPSKDYTLAVVIRVKEGRDIRMPGTSDVWSSYFVLTCGGEKIRGPIAKSSVTPHWDTDAVFYVTDDHKPTAKIQVWGSGVVRDRLIGEAELELRETKPPKMVGWIVPLVPSSIDDPRTTLVTAGKVVLEAMVTSNMSVI